MDSTETSKNSSDQSNPHVSEMDVAAVEQPLLQSVCIMKKRTGRGKRKLFTFRQRLRAAERYSQSMAFKRNIIPRLTPAADQLLRLKFRESAKRRFTDNEKVLCLSIFKRNPKAYDVLYKMFTLPSRETMNKFLRTVTLRPGINKQLFRVLKKQVVRMQNIDKCCSLLYNEIRLAPRLRYNSKTDEVEGFVDNGIERQRKFADRALVFMARGVRKKWKQAVAFSLGEGTTTALELKGQIKMVIGELQNIGLRVISTVSDQTKPNVTAISYLINETRENYVQKGKKFNGGFFEVQGQTIVPLYDAPHLLRAFRNNLIKQHLHFTLNGQRMIAKWEHIERMYKLDREEENPSLPKLTDAHIYPNSLQKLKVSYCAEVFSQRMAALLYFFSKHLLSHVDQKAEGTAHFVIFMDKLFDSVNSSNCKVDDLKTLRGPFKNGSPHLKFWAEAIPVLQSMEFVNPVDSTASKPPSIQNWIHTIQGLQLIWKKLQVTRFKFLLLRNFNQDPLDNFFASLRSQGARNIKPSCTAFIAGFKTLAINNFMSPHSLGSKFEEDKNDKEGLLVTLRDMLLSSKDD